MQWKIEAPSIEFNNLVSIKKKGFREGDSLL